MALRFQWLNPRSWFDEGRGALVLGAAVLAVAVLGVSLWLLNQRWQGPKTEHTTEQLVLARQLARGEGYTTPVVHPQVVSLLARRQLGDLYVRGSTTAAVRQADGNVAPPTYTAPKVPELYHAPLYPTLLAGAYSLAGAIAPDPETGFYAPPVGRSGQLPQYSPDLLAAIVNILLLWVVIGLSYFLAYRLFGALAAGLTALSVGLSATLWQETFALSGFAVGAIVLLGIFLAWSLLEEARTEDKSKPEGWLWPWWAAAMGAGVGLLFLHDYVGLLILPVLLVYFALAFRGAALALVLVACLSALAAASVPWMVRNVTLTGHPMGLAGQSIMLRAEDPTADPQFTRTIYSAEEPTGSFNKVVNKGLTALRENLGGAFWADGGYLFAGFFLASILYLYKRADTDTLRWCALATVALLLVGAPFFNSGEEDRRPLLALAPLISVFGAGFAVVLLEGLRKRLLWERWALIAVMGLLQAAPLVQTMAAPANPVRFQNPPYQPPALAGVAGLVRNTVGSYVMMADIPAGTAWYGDIGVWGVTSTLREFFQVDSLHRRPPPAAGERRAPTEEGVAVLLLTPRTLHEPLVDPNGLPLNPLLRDVKDTTRPGNPSWFEVVYFAHGIRENQRGDRLRLGDAFKTRAYPLTRPSFSLQSVLPIGYDHLVFAREMR